MFANNRCATSACERVEKNMHARHLSWDRGNIEYRIEITVFCFSLCLCVSVVFLFLPRRRKGLASGDAVLGWKLVPIMVFPSDFGGIGLNGVI